ncbi:MAG: hypothetical protein IJ797_10600 [Selenomonadaceae bacterium]|nr:hypothetical protein [Selenomonadaceae bacterium]
MWYLKNRTAMRLFSYHELFVVIRKCCQNKGGTVGNEVKQVEEVVPNVHNITPSYEEADHRLSKVIIIYRYYFVNKR